MRRPKVHVTEPIHADAMTLLATVCDVVPDPLIADAIVVRVARLGPPGPMLRLVAKHGVGVDNLDLPGLAAAGVQVMNTPGANSGAVAEHALMLMLALARDLAGLERAARAGAKAAPVAGVEGKRLLIVGYGASGRALAVRGAALGMAVSVFGPRLQDERTPDGYAVVPDLWAGLAQADIVSLHCPLNDVTRGMIGARELAGMPAGAIVINCARGGIVDEGALIFALKSGHLGGAGLDCTPVEPLRADDPLLAAPRLILTPHAAASSAGAFRTMGMMAVQNVLDFFAGQPNSNHIIRG